MLNRSASLAMSTSVLEALLGKFDIKRHSPSILYLWKSIFTCPWASISFCYFNNPATDYTKLHGKMYRNQFLVFWSYSVTVKATTLIFISGRGSAISTVQEGKSGSIYLVKS